MSESATPTAIQPRLKVSLGAQPMIEVETANLAETELVEELIWQAMLARTSAPELSCAAESSNERAGGRQRYLFGPWVAPHLTAIAAVVEQELISGEVPEGMQILAIGANESAAGQTPVIGAAPEPDSIPVIGAAGRVLTVPEGAIPVIGGVDALSPPQVPVIGDQPVSPSPLVGQTEVPVIGETRPAPAVIPVIGPDVSPPSAPEALGVPVIGSSAQVAPSPAAAWGSPQVPLSEAAAVGWTMPLEVQRELTELRAASQRLGAAEAERARLEGERGQLSARVRTLEAEAGEVTRLRARVSELEAAGRAALTGLRAGAAALEAAGL